MLWRIWRFRLRRMWLVGAGCAASFAGVLVARTQPMRIGWWLWLGVGAVLSLLVVRTVLALLLLIAVCFTLGWWRGSVMIHRLQPYAAWSLQKVTVVGSAADDAVYGKSSQLTFGLREVHMTSPVQVPLPGELTISGFGTSAIFRGDTVQASGKLYPTRGNNLASISFADLQVSRQPASRVDLFRRRFTAGLQSALPEPQASFGMGLLIGQRNTLPADTSQTLLAVGLTHLIAVSGYNLTIIVQAVRRLFEKRSKYQTIIVSFACVCLFLLITGSSPSIVRAAIISMLSLLAWYYGRRFQPLVLLMVAAAVSVLANPLYAWGNVSWYLSFLAFFGVLVVGPIVTRRLFGERQPKLLAQIVIECVCAEAMTVPYVLYIFGQVSLVGILANVLVAVWVPLAMLLCMIAGLAGMLLPLLAGWLAWPTTILLTYMLDTSTLLSRIPHAFVQHIAFGVVWLVGYYVALGLVLSGSWRGRIRKGERSALPSPTAAKVNRVPGAR